MFTYVNNYTDKHYLCDCIVIVLHQKLWDLPCSHGLGRIICSRHKPKAEWKLEIWNHGDWKYCKPKLQESPSSASSASSASSSSASSSSASSPSSSSMCMCMCIYIYTRTYRCTYLPVHKYTYIDMQIYRFKCICVLYICVSK